MNAADPAEALSAEPAPADPSSAHPVPADPVPADPAPADPAPVDSPPRGTVWIALLAWMVPGAGHLVLGRWRRGIAFLALVLAAIGIGVDLGGELWWFDRTRPVTWLAAPACLGMGLPYGALRWLLGYRGQLMGAGYEYGGAFLLTAGLMNLLLVLDSVDVARGHKA